MRGSRRFDGLERRAIHGIEVPVAEAFRSRLLGLAFLDDEEAGDGLLIPRCRGVHTWGMRFRIHVFFLGREGEAMRVVEAVPVGRLLYEPEAEAVLEVPARLRG